MNSDGIMGEGEYHRSFWESIARDGANRHAYIDWLIENGKEANAKHWRSRTDARAARWARELIATSDKDLADNAHLYKRR